MRSFNANPGEHITDACARAVSRAQKGNDSVMLIFNGIELLAGAYDSPLDLAKQYFLKLAEPTNKDNPMLPSTKMEK